jgi:hypothetical protein
MQTGEDEDMPDQTSVRKRPTLEASSLAAAPGGGSSSTVADIVNRLEPGIPGMELAVTSLGKIQPPKQTRRDDELQNQNISATSRKEVVREK